MPRWLSRLLWMTAQAAMVGGGLWLSFLSEPRPQEPMPPLAYVVIPALWVCVAAFATACITRAWDKSVLAVFRLRSGMRQREETGREELGIRRPVTRTDQRAEIGQGRRIG